MDIKLNSNKPNFDNILSTLDKGANKVNQALDDFQHAIPLLEAIGISTKTVEFEMSVPPMLMATLVGDISATNTEVIQQYIDENSDKSLLVLILKGFIGAYEIREKLSNIGLNGLELDLKLTAPPSIAVRMLAAAP